MALFKQNKEPFNPANLLIFLVVALVIVYMFAQIFGSLLGISFKPGPVLIVLSVGIASLMAVAMVRKVMLGYPLDKPDIFAVIITAALAFVVMFFLKGAVPDLFSVGIFQLQSMIGL